MQLVMLTNTLLNHNIDAFYRQLFVQVCEVETLKTIRVEMLIFLLIFAAI